MTDDWARFAPEATGQRPGAGVVRADQGMCQGDLPAAVALEPHSMPCGLLCADGCWSLAACPRIFPPRMGVMYVFRPMAVFHLSNCRVGQANGPAENGSA